MYGKVNELAKFAREVQKMRDLQKDMKRANMMIARQRQNQERRVDLIINAIFANEEWT